MIRHAAHPEHLRDFPLCGEDPNRNVVELATPGQLITCPQCRATIIWAKAVKHFHAPPDDVTVATREAFGE